MTTQRSALQALPLFADLTEREIAVLKAHVRRVRLGPDVRLFTEGDRGSSCYIIVAGSVVVLKTLDLGFEKLAELQPGALVGHLSLIDHKPRSASCRSGAEGAVLLELGRAEFDRLFLAQSPFTYKLLDRITMDLAARLRAATGQLIRTQREGRDRDDVRQVAIELSGYQGAVAQGVDLDGIRAEVPAEVALLTRTPPPTKP